MTKNTHKDTRRLALELASRLVAPGPNSADMMIDTARKFVDFLEGEKESLSNDR